MYTRMTPTGRESVSNVTTTNLTCDPHGYDSGFRAEICRRRYVAARLQSKTPDFSQNWACAKSLSTSCEHLTAGYRNGPPRPRATNFVKFYYIDRHVPRVHERQIRTSHFVRSAPTRVFKVRTKLCVCVCVCV